MGTTFEEIYNLNKIIKNDIRLQNKPSNLIERQLYGALIFSISEFLADCYKDLSNRIDFEEKEYTIQAKAGDTAFTLDSPPINLTNIYVNIEDNSVTYNYSYDETTSILTISPALTKDCEVYASLYRKGYFNEVLNDVEKTILAEGMSIPFIEESRNRNDLLNQMVFNGDARINSQANHITSLNESIQMQYDLIVRPKIRDYSYKFSPNRLLGMSGNPNYTPTGGAYKW